MEHKQWNTISTVEASRTVENKRETNGNSRFLIHRRAEADPLFHLELLLEGARPVRTLVSLCVGCLAAVLRDGAPSPARRGVLPARSAQTGFAGPSA